ncbi:restriction endonuclease subunit S [Helicobacter bizzozeronii]|uniref:restriction endonuclease subunit S n=1 Tax=Helicobacter bizzozeronii TaxID=56877 RepID=UPI000CF1BA3F|nr:restriction endonuclease subunit S [Helicobacter bizzozeronii]
MQNTFLNTQAPNLPNQTAQRLFSYAVEFVELGGIVKIQKGQQLNKSLLSKEGKYPVMNGGTTPSGYWHAFNAPADTIIIAQGGSAGFVSYMKTLFWAGAHCYIVELRTDIVLYPFLYFFLKSHQTILMSMQYGATIPALKQADIEALKIPLPPLSVQEKIVKILEPLSVLSGEC